MGANENAAINFVVEQLDNSSEGWHTGLYFDEIEAAGITKEEIEAAADRMTEEGIVSEFTEYDDSYYIVTFTDYAYNINPETLEKLDPDFHLEED